MSSIGFRSLQGTVRIGGAERQYLAGMVRSTYVNLWKQRCRDVPTFDRLAGLVGIRRDAECDVLQKWPDLERAITHSEGDFCWRDRRFDMYVVQLNTSLVLGGFLRFAARIHGQCDVHCFVEGPNRAWFADMLDNYSRTSLLSPPLQNYSTWQEVSALFRASDSSPVVLDSSFCDPWHPQEDEEEGISKEDAWEEAMVELRNPEEGLEMSPLTWDTDVWDEGISSFDLFSSNWEEILARKLEISPENK